MGKQQVDVAIIGAGTAGLTARRGAEKNGASALLFDPGPLGTTCARVGCMPSKLLIAAADVAHHVQDGETFGLETTLKVDGRRVMERVRRERDRFTGFVLDTSATLEEEGKLIRSKARFAAPGLITTDEGHHVEYKAAVIAAGTAPFVPPPYRDIGDRMLTNEHIFELETLPESVLVVGIGVIGLELGQALHRLGVRVTLLGLDNLITGLQDPTIKQTALRVFKKELDLHAHHQLHSVERLDEGVRVSFTDAEGQRRTEDFEYVLMATGRRPDLRSMDLEAAGVRLDDRGMPTFDYNTMQIAGHPLFIAGDVTGFRPLLHEAADEGRIAGENAATFPEVLWHRRRTPLAIVFCDPNIATVGMPYGDVRKVDHAVGAVDYGDQGRSRVMNQHRGWVHIYGAKDDGRLLGAEMVGPRVEHTAHLLAWAIQEGLTVQEALRMPFYHPVVEEGIRTALRNLQTNLHMAPRAAASIETVGPGV